MVERWILMPVLPEIDAGGVERLARLIRRESEAGIAPHPLRRLAALLPVDPDLASAVAARLRLSNRAAKRLTAAANRGEADGQAPAVDRILLGDTDPRSAVPLLDWRRPRLRVGGGDLIAMGLEPGPVVARTLQAIEREWAQAGFLEDLATQRAIARRHVDQVLRESR
jgi:poly(A) polymerase